MNSIIQEFRDFVKEWAIFIDDPLEQDYQKMVEQFLLSKVREARVEVYRDLKKYFIEEERRGLRSGWYKDVSFDAKGIIKMLDDLAKLSTLKEL